MTRSLTIASTISRAKGALHAAETAPVLTAMESDVVTTREHRSRRVDRCGCKSALRGMRDHDGNLPSHPGCRPGSNGSPSASSSAADDSRSGSTGTRRPTRCSRGRRSGSPTMATASRSQPMQPSPNPYPPHLCAPRPSSRPAANRQDARAKALLPMEPLRRDFSGAPERPNDSRLGQTRWRIFSPRLMARPRGRRTLQSRWLSW
jgi:hypothetical protein